MTAVMAMVRMTVRGGDCVHLSVAFLVPTGVHGEGSGSPFASVATARLSRGPQC